MAEFFWPSQGYHRSIRYLGYRVKRLPATPHAIAAGFASGAAMSFLPLIGLHFLLSFALAWMVRGNMIAAALGTAVGNPLTFPIIYSTAYRLGYQMLSVGNEPLAEPPDLDVAAESELLIEQGLTASTLETLLPMLRITFVGAIPMASVAFLVFYTLIFILTSRFQATRRQRRTTQRLRPAE